MAWAVAVGVVLGMGTPCVSEEDEAVLAPQATEEAAPAPQATEEAAPAAPGELQFNFQFAPWKDVLDWLATQADLSLVMDAPPPGTFNYTDARSYTPVEALDLLNGILLTKDFALVRRGRMLMVVDLAEYPDGLPPNLVPIVPLERLDEYGQHELVRVVFPLAKLSADEANSEIGDLLGPQSAVVLMPKSRQIQVLDTAGRLRVIRSVFDAVENPYSRRGAMREFPLEFRLADEVLPVVRQMLGLDEETNVLPDDSLRIAVDLSGRRLIVQGDADELRQLEEVLKLVDVPGPEGSIGVAEVPQLEVYSVTGSDPASVLAVLQTLLAGDPDARLATDPQTGNLVALARPSQHATVRATIAQMQRDARQIDVIPLTSVDPQTAVLAINNLFGATGEKPNPMAPKVDADLATRSLLVRGSPSQLLQIRALLEKLGESLSEDGMRGSGGNVRLLPLSGRAAQGALYQLEQVWPTIRPNRIRVVTPSTSGIPAFRPGDRRGDRREDWQDGPSRESTDSFPSYDEQFPSFDGRRPQTPSPPPGDASTDSRRRVRAVFANQRTGPPPDQADRVPAGDRVGVGDRETADSNTNVNPRADQSPRSDHGTPGAEILIAPGPGGVLIASQDLEALDDFETLLTTIANRATSGGREFAVYYLRYAKATTVAETVTEIFGGGGGGATGGGGLLGDIAGAALGGGAAGDLMGNLLGLGGGGGVTALGAVDVVPDPRLNALIVRGKPADLDTLEQLLQILDQPGSPEEVEVEAPPRLIPVYNTSAEYIQGVVQQVYQDRLRSGAGQRREPSPEELIRALRGGGRGRGSNEREQEEATKMSIGVDTNSNSLVVRAPDQLFQDVKRLVETLDTVEPNLQTATQIISLKATSPSAVQKALTALFGESVQVTSASGGGSGTPAAASTPGGARSGGATPDAIRRQMFQQLRDMRRGGRGGDRPGGGTQGRGRRGGGSGDGGRRGGPSGRQR